MTSIFGSILPATCCILDHRGELALLYPFLAALDALGHVHIQAEAPEEGLFGSAKISPIQKFFSRPGFLYERDLGLL